jgi:integrase
LKRTKITDYGQLSPLVVVRSEQSYARQFGLNRADMQRRGMQAFRAFAWALGVLGKTTPTINGKERPKEEPAVNAFLEYGRRLGWAEQTLRARHYWLRLLRSFQHRRRGPWPVPCLRDLDRFLQFYSQRSARETIIQAASSLRAWLRFLYVTKRTKYDLAAAVMVPVQRPFARPARTLPWSSVRRLARGINRATPIGRRDYALYLLLCAYGLGSSELVDLKLEDLDWQANLLHIRRRKTGVAIDLPLLPAVAGALAAYLRHGRPSSSSGYVFLSQYMPHAPLNAATITTLVVHWATQSKIEAPRLNARMLRHSHATRQLEHGVSLKVIGDILGHQDSMTTSRYVRCALNRLRRIALPVPV